MQKVTKELLKEAFIKPIRFALLIDDNFPVYPRMAESGKSDELDYDKARILFNYCRENGWLCDIDNGVDVAKNFQKDKHLNQSDLLVLDFHLNPSSSEDSSDAIRIIQQLSKSNNFNLVIVYTAAEPSAVVRDIAFSLGAGSEQNPEYAATAKQHLEQFDTSDEEQIKKLFSTGIIDDYLNKKRPGLAAKNLRDFLKEIDISDGNDQNNIIHYLCGQYFGARLDRSIIEQRATAASVTGSYAAESKATWVTSGNVFAVVVNKTEPPSVFIERLVDALSEWNPSPARVMMVHARTALEEAGGLHDEAVLESPRREAGWMLKVLLSENPEDKALQIRELYGRLFEGLISRIGTNIETFGTRIINHNTDKTPTELARILAGGDQLLTDDLIFHALNEYLCSDRQINRHITTGMIFRGKRQELEEYWLCMTPACDLVPGQNMRGWDKDLHPYRPISAARLSVIKGNAGVSVRLRDATKGRHIFLFEDNKPIALEIADEQSRQMKLETILVSDNGKIEDEKFTGFVIELDDKKLPTPKQIEFTAIANLRSDYANRFLAESGFQRSRIGVDFINFQGLECDPESGC